MTAEVYVCNKTCIALAADSASSIGRDKLKIYNGVEKLFPLSRRYPIGIMIFGQASFMRMPWEAIIKQYRKLNGDKAYDTTEQYAQAFLRYLQELSKNHITEEHEQSYIQMRIDSLLQAVLFSLDSTSEDWLDVTVDESEKQVTAICQGLQKNVVDNKNYTDVKDFVVREYSDYLRAQLNNIFESAKKKNYLTEKFIEVISETTFSLYFDTRADFLTSGIVISGFGEDEMFPSCFSYRLAGTLEKKLFYWTYMTDEADGFSRIIPFAQDEMAQSFLMGLSPTASTNINSMLEGIIEDFLVAAEQSGVDNDSLENLKERTQQSILERHSHFQNLQSELHPKKIMDMLSHLPKEELAQLAETLVSLTALKQRITDSDETVGGPIDVAVISKGDGFIWMKRKHYFDPDLNRDYTWRTRL